MNVYPSIASADPLRIADELNKIRGHSRVHIDIEDGNFLPNITFGTKMIGRLMEEKDFIYDLHLLVNHPYDFLQSIKKYRFSHISFHIESSNYPLREINLIKNMGAKVGIALNFKTGVEVLLPFIFKMDYVLIMTSEPDEEGEHFQKGMLQKIKSAKEILPKNIEIWADGGINEENIHMLKEESVDAAIVGRAIWSSSSPLKKIQEMEKL